MRGSYLAKIIEEEQQREKRLRGIYAKRRFIKEKCIKCKNKKAELCHITLDIEGKPKCVNYKVEQNT